MARLSEYDKAILNCVFNPNLPLEETAEKKPESLEDIEEDSKEVAEAKKLELEAVKLAEKAQLQESLALLNKAIEIAPKRPSPYNNRANIYQYLRRFEDAFNDLTIAIDLAGDKYKKTLCQAHCQRGILHRRADRVELARGDFEIAATLGSQFAKSQLVEMNPYAALCNQMLKQVMDTLK